MNRATQPPAADAEFNVIAGYRTVGGIVSCGSLLLIAAILFGGLRNKHGDPIPTSMVNFVAPLLLFGIAMLLAEWRVTLSPASQTASVRRGLGPFVRRTQIDIGGDKGFVIGTARGRHGTSVSVDLEVAHLPARVAVLRNATKDTFERVSRVAPSLKAPLRLRTPTDEAPPWLTEGVDATNAQLST